MKSLCQQPVWLALALGVNALVTGCQPSPPASAARPDPDRDPNAVPLLTDYEHVNPVADKAWEELLVLGRPAGAPTAAGPGRPPSPADWTLWRDDSRTNYLLAAAYSKLFYEKFPRHPRNREARDKEIEFLGAAVQLGASNALPRYQQLEQARLNDPRLTPDERYGLRSQRARQLAAAYGAEGTQALRDELREEAGKLAGEFPDRPEAWTWLLTVAADSHPDKTGELVARIVASNSATPETQSAAQVLLRQRDQLGKPLELAFTAADGRPVDLVRLRGKVVLLHFWASWSAPCQETMPLIVAAHRQFQGRGLEVVGVSLDAERPGFDQAVARHGLVWPQHYDGKVWENDIARRLGVSRLPSLWLLDRQGRVRELNARTDLAGKIQVLLDEP
jgi:thiol-disulfide isomerase/thioredoxin